MGDPITLAIEAPDAHPASRRDTALLSFAHIFPRTPHTSRPPLTYDARTRYEENNDIGEIPPEGLVMQSDILEQEVGELQDMEPAFEGPSRPFRIMDRSFA